MSKLTQLLLAAWLAIPALTYAGDAPAEERPRGGDDRRERFFERMREENPELKDVDFNSPEGQAKMREVMQARMEKEAPRIRERIAERQAQEYTELGKQFNMSAEEFNAIQPLIARVDNLRAQHGMVDNTGAAGGFGGRGRGGPGGGNGFFNPTMLLGDTPMEPTVKEIQEALQVLRTLVKDAQANDTEVTSALARLRKGREAFATVLKNARAELRAVLTAHQEAILVDRGTLE